MRGGSLATAMAAYGGALGGEAGERVRFYAQPCPRGCHSGYLGAGFCDCPKGQRAAEWEATQRDSVRETQAAEAEARLARRLAALPEQYQGYTLDESPATAHPGGREAISQLTFWTYAWTGRQNLLLLGDVGSGKTGLAVCALTLLLPQLIARGGDLRWWDAGAFTQELWDRPRENRSVSELLAEMIAADVLVLDDVGVEGPLHEMVAGHWFNLINSRYAARRSTILTSNLSIDELRAHLGARAWSRLTEERGGEERGSVVHVPARPRARAAH